MKYSVIGDNAVIAVVWGGIKNLLIRLLVVTVTRGRSLVLCSVHDGQVNVKCLIRVTIVVLPKLLKRIPVCEPVRNVTRTRDTVICLITAYK